MGPLPRSSLALLPLAAALAAPAPAAGEPAVRVRLLQSQGPVRVVPEGGALHVVEARPVENGLRVDGRPARSPLRVVGDGAVEIEGRRYRGALEFHRRDGQLLVVNEVPLEDYVAGTLHREVYPSWDGAALLAQAVATRTYALYRMDRSRGDLHHLDDGPGDQVYGGLEAETPAARRAAQATRGEYLAFDGEPILAAYHSAAGGRTASAEEVWGRAMPYLVSLEVPGEELSPDTYWRVAISAQELTRALEGAGESVGVARNLRVLERGPSGRVRRLSIEGPRGPRELTSRRLRRALGSRTLRSSLYDVRRDGDSFVFIGSGYGHGVGMSQWGARALAKRGLGYRDILARFYPGTELRRLGEGLPGVAAGGAAR